MKKVMPKLASLAGIMMLGDAIAYALGPRRHISVWRFRREPDWYRRLAEMTSKRRVGIATALAEAAVGVSLVKLAQRRAT